MLSGALPSRANTDFSTDPRACSCHLRIPVQSRCLELGPTRTLSQHFPLLRAKANLPPNTALIEKSKLDFSEFGQPETAIKVLLMKSRLCCSTPELVTAPLHSGVMVNSDPQGSKAATQTAKTGICGARGIYITVQLENRPKLQISASKIRTQIPGLSFPDLSSSLQAWKGVMPWRNGSQSSVLQRQSWNFYELTYKTIH